MLRVLRETGPVQNFDLSQKGLLELASDLVGKSFVRVCCMYAYNCPSVLRIARAVSHWRNCEYHLSRFNSWFMAVTKVDASRSICPGSDWLME